MADNLTPDELDVLARIDAKEQLRPFFFRKAKGLKWFDALDQRGYFNPANNSAPVPAKEEGYVSVPFWPAIEYLVATSPEFLKDENRAYAERVLNILRAVTKAAITNGFSNYRTWWQFSKIVRNIPIDLINRGDVDIFDYWLDDKYERDLVAESLGEKWLVALLDESTDHSKIISLALLQVLYKTSFIEKNVGDSNRKEARFRFGKWHANRITNAVSGKAGKSLGEAAVDVFRSQLERVLGVLNNDRWSSMWRGAIEDHAQNHSADDVEDILIVGLRDALGAYVGEVPAEASNKVEQLLIGQLETVKRIAIYTVNHNFQHLNGLVGLVIVEDHFKSNFRHEVWHLLRNRYPQFSESQKQRVLSIIRDLAEQDDDGGLDTRATAYAQAVWLSAIENHDGVLRERYNELVGIAGVEPDHPEFSSYWSSGPVVHESPMPADDLLAMGLDDLISYLDVYKDPGNFRGPGLEGLAQALKQAAKAAPLTWAGQLEKFAKLDSAYVYVLLEAYSELWGDKSQLPWDDVWPRLLKFCEEIISQEEFWSEGNSQQRKNFVANRHWVVGSIGRLIEAGTKSDDHAFSSQLLERAKDILLALLRRQPGEEFKPDSDAVSVAINSPRGRCLEALINLSLRSCRLVDKSGGGHDEVWLTLKGLFDAELQKSADNEYEFATLVVNYLSNFLYMSKKWVLENLSQIFDQGNYQKWLCAMQAYAYVGRVYIEIFNHLKANEHFIRALDDDYLKEKISETIVQNAVSTYLNDYESLQDDTSLIRQLFERRQSLELSHLIWFIWTLRENNDEKLYKKVIELWPRLIDVIDIQDMEGRKLASRLSTWAVFISKVDDRNRDLLHTAASFVEENHNSFDLLKAISRISAEQPDEAVAIWKAMLQVAAPDYPEEAVRDALANLIRSGDQGRRDAHNIVSEYIKRGNESPSLWLREIERP